MCIIAEAHGISAKCKILTLDYSSGKIGSVVNHIYFVDEAPIKLFGNEDSFEYLSYAFGYEEKCSLQKILDDTTTMIEKFTSSGLAPSQIYYALLFFSLPKLSYVFRTADISETSLNKFDLGSRKNISEIFHLPFCSFLEFIQAPPDHGGLGLATSSELRAYAVIA